MGGWSGESGGGSESKERERDEVRRGREREG